MKTKVWLVTNLVADPKDSSNYLERAATMLMVTSMPRFRDETERRFNMRFISEEALKEIDAAVASGARREHEVTDVDNFQMEVIEDEESLQPEGYMQEIHIVIVGSDASDGVLAGADDVARRFHRHQQLLAAGLVQRDD